MAANTGGAAAPAAPRTPPVRATPQRYLNKASGRMETQQAMKGFKAPTNVRAAATARALGAPSGHALEKPPGPHPHPQTEHQAALSGREFNEATGKTETKQQEAGYDRRFPGTAVLNPGGFSGDQMQGIEQLIANSTKARTNAEVQPFQQKGREIEGTQKTVEGRFGKYAGQTQEALGTLQSQATGDARTAANLAANATLQAERGIETTGQTQQTLNGGYLDPQVKAAMEAGSAQARGIGAAAQAGTEARGQGENQFLTNIRAAAVQRAQEGQQNVQSIYGKQLTQNRGRESEALARGAARAKELGITLPKELLTSKLAQAKFANEGIKIGQKQEEIGQKGRMVNLNKQIGGARISKSEQERKEKTAKEPGELSKQQADIAQKRADVAYKNLTSTDKAAYDKWKMSQTGPGGTSKPISATSAAAADRKYTQTLNNALSTAKAELARGEKRGYRGQQLYNIAVKQLGEGKYTGKGGAEPGNPMGQNLIHAALSLIFNKGKLVGKPRQEALEAGLSPNSPWLK